MINSSLKKFKVPKSIASSNFRIEFSWLIALSKLYRVPTELDQNYFAPKLISLFARAIYLAKLNEAVSDLS